MFGWASHKGPNLDEHFMEVLSSITNNHPSTIALFAFGNSLYKLYYRDKEVYKNTYNNRINSENTIKFDFKIYGNDAFIFLHKDIMSYISNISSLDNRVTYLLSTLPSIAREQYIKKSLIDEIVYTNEIEGIVSTRKQIGEMINDIEYRVKKKERFSSLVYKYMLLMTDKFKELNSPSNIREIYDELVLEEIIKDIFRFDFFM